MGVSTMLPIFLGIMMKRDINASFVIKSFCTAKTEKFTNVPILENDRMSASCVTGRLLKSVP